MFSIELTTLLAPNDMSGSIALPQFGALLERHLPAVDDVLAHAAEHGFHLCEIFIDERLKLVDQSHRELERKLLLLSCREEFCNFKQYTRDTGGDGLSLSDLQVVRDGWHKKHGIQLKEKFYLLQSDVAMRSSLAVARQFAKEVHSKTFLQLMAERERYLENAELVLTTFGLSPFVEKVKAILERIFSGFGFGACQARKGTVGFTKKLRGSNHYVVACFEGMPWASSTWSGDIEFQLYLQASPLSLDGPTRTCCVGRSGVPLRLTGLAPGLDAYRRGIYLASPSQGSSPMRETITLKELELDHTESQIVALAHVALAADCYMSIFCSVEQSITAALEAAVSL